MMSARGLAGEAIRRPGRRVAGDTTDTSLFRPSQRRVPEEKPFMPDFVVERWLAVMHDRRPEESGGCWGWAGKGYRCDDIALPLCLARGLECFDQAAHLVIGADRDAQEIAQSILVEMTHQNAAFTQFAENHRATAFRMTHEQEIGL